MVGRVFHAPMIAATEGLTLAAVATSRAAEVAAALPGVAIHPTPEALIADASLNIVVVATPNDRHAPLAAAALAAGRHVVVEKPMTVTLEDARMLAEAAARHGRILATFQNRRWDSDFLTIARAIHAGAIGRVVQFESRFDRYRPEVADRWREVPAPGGGVWYDLGPHLVDQALLLFGLPDGVTLSLARLRDDARVDDWAHAILSYPDKRVLLTASLLTAATTPRFAVHGTTGSIVKWRPDQQENRLRSGLPPWADGAGPSGDPLLLHDGQGLVHDLPEEAGDQREFYRRLAAAVRGEGCNPVPLADAVAVMATIVAGVRSAEEGRMVPLELTDRERRAFADGAADRTL